MSQLSKEASGAFDNPAFAVSYYRDMVRSRVLEEQLIHLWKLGKGFFWTGGPGEEAVNVALGRLLWPGKGPAFDYFHPHYRSAGVVLTMGAPMISAIRQMKSLSTDPFTGGRNFVCHSAIPDWNVMAVSSPIASQCLVGLGTARAQMKLRTMGQAHGITVVVIGDASCGSPDFENSLVWGSRPGQELPILTIVTNNGFGISTSTQTQLSALSSRAKAFGISSASADGMYAEKTYRQIESAFDYVRKSGRAFVLELKVSRLYGHSSSSGANRIPGEDCPIEIFEKKLLSQKIPQDMFIAIRREAEEEFRSSELKTENERYPQASTYLQHSFAGNFVGGLPKK